METLFPSLARWHSQNPVNLALNVFLQSVSSVYGGERTTLADWPPSWIEVRGNKLFFGIRPSPPFFLLTGTIRCFIPKNLME